LKLDSLKRLAKLRTDADWWLTNSEGEVKIATIIWIERVAKSLRIEKVVSTFAYLKASSFGRRGENVEARTSNARK
jgi:hypothetical protein